MSKKLVEYWSPKRVLETIFRIFLIIGGRGVGKTFNVIGESLDDLFFNNESMIYLRRLGVEVDELEKQNFITEKLLKVYFKERFSNYNFDESRQIMRFTIDEVIHEIRVIRNKIFFDNRCIIYFLALSRAGHVKSNNYPNIKYLVFDEVIIDRSISPNARYIRNEFTVLLNLIETVKRERKDFYLFMLSNVGENFNPVFAGLGYYLTHEDIKKGFIEKSDYCIELVENKIEELDTTDPFVRLGLKNKDFSNSKTNAFENIRTPNFGTTTNLPMFLIKYDRQYLGVVKRIIPSGLEYYYKQYQDISAFENIPVYNFVFDTLVEGEIYIEPNQMRKKFKNYLELFQQNMVIHENSNSFLEWSKFVYTIK